MSRALANLLKSYGSIGRQAAKVCKAMGMDVYAFTASPKETSEAKKDRDYNVPGVGDPEGEVPSKWFSGECPSCSSHVLILV